MRFLDLDLDFFLNKNAYYSGSNSGRLGAEYKPWSGPRVQHFLEERCSLSSDTPVPGRTIESHDRVIDFWHILIESGSLSVPFEVIHVDAHPDLSARGGLHLASGLLFMGSESELALFKEEHVHSGNYLTFAIACGWIASLVWVPLRKTLTKLPNYYDDAGHGQIQLKDNKAGEFLKGNFTVVERKGGIPFKIIHWSKFKTNETFDYMALSKSPNFTPPESDSLIAIIELYMKQI